MGRACFAAGSVCLLYYGAILYIGNGADFAWIWAAGSIVFWILSLFFWLTARSQEGSIRFLRYLTGFLLAGCVALLAVLGTRIIIEMGQKTENGLDYVVVLGAQVRGKVPSRALQRRIDKALEYAMANPDTTLVLSGGQGEGEEISEAECMRTYLVTHGVEEDRLIKEENSTSTRENLLFSDALTGCGKARTGVLSNNFHLHRALLIAKKLGYQDVTGIAASGGTLLQPHFIIRECFALIVEKMRGSI